MTLKLYRVEVTKVGYVLAKDEREAEGFESEIDLSEEGQVEVWDVHRYAECAAHYWTLDCCVYHNHPDRKDILLKEAIDIDRSTKTAKAANPRGDAEGAREETEQPDPSTEGEGDPGATE
jgi:hypothetical protein